MYVHICNSFITVELFCKNYRKKGSEMVFHVAKDNKEFEKAHNILQDQLKALGGTDDLLCGKQCKLYIHSLYVCRYITVSSCSVHVHSFT